MSTFATRRCTCPRCGASEERSLAVTLDGSDQAEAILSDRFQSFSCGCGASYVVDDPFVLVDFERGHWIAALPARNEAAWRRFEHESHQLWQLHVVRSAPPIVREMGARMTIRTTFGLAGLRDKLVALRSGLDDVALELLKLDLMRSELGLAPSLRPRLAAVEADRLLFTVRGRTEHLAVPRERLDDIALDPLEWAVAHESVSRGPYVDVGRLLIPGHDEAARAAFP